MAERVSLFGIEIDNLTRKEVFSEIEKMIKQKKTNLVVTPNVQHINIIQKDKEFKKIYDEASLVINDSKPLLWSSRILGSPIKERIPGSDLLPLFCEVAAKKKYKLFFLGAEPGIAKKAAEILENKNPGLQIVQTYSPPFGFEHNQQENHKIIKMINSCNPDVLFVGLGTPKGEKWSWIHRNELSVSVIISVGAAFNFITQNVKRAPSWMQTMGLEWFHRLIQEPGRLWKRYLIGNAFFIWLTIKEAISKKLLKKDSR